MNQKHAALASQIVATGMLEDLREQIRSAAFTDWANLTPELSAQGEDQRQRDLLLGRLQVLQQIENMAQES